MCFAFRFIIAQIPISIPSSKHRIWSIQSTSTKSIQPCSSTTSWLSWVRLCFNNSTSIWLYVLSEEIHKMKRLVVLSWNLYINLTIFNPPLLDKLYFTSSLCLFILALNQRPRNHRYTTRLHNKPQVLTPIIFLSYHQDFFLCVMHEIKTKFSHFTLKVVTQDMVDFRHYRSDFQ